MNESCIRISTSDHEFGSIEDLFDLTQPASHEITTGTTITFLTDITIHEPISITKTCNFDLNGHYLFVSVESGITVKNGAKVEFTQGNIQSLSDNILSDTLIVQGTRSTLVLGDSLNINTHGTAIHVRRRGSLVIQGADVNSTGDQPTVYVEDSGSNAILNSGSIISYEKSALVIRNSGVAHILGGSICTYSDGIIPEDAFSSVLVNGQGSTLYISGGKVSSDITSAVKIQNTARSEITGGEIISSSKDYPPIIVENNDSTLIVTEGFIHSNHTIAVVSNLIDAAESHTITVFGGTLSAQGELFLTGGSGEHRIQVSGGRIKGHLSSNYISEGYCLSSTPDEDGYYHIVREDSEVSTDVMDDNTITPSNESSEESDIIEDSTLEEEILIPETLEETTPSLDYSEDSNTVLLPSSLNIQIPTYIYHLPSRLKVLTLWKGALSILDERYQDSGGTEFVKVKIRVPGSGDVMYGYSVVLELLSNS